MKVVKQQDIHLHAVKKFTAGNPATEFDYPVGGVDNVANNDDVWASAAQLVAGTAWLFADTRADQQFDVLFVDEAGQVAFSLWLYSIPHGEVQCPSSIGKRCLPFCALNSRSIGRATMEFLTGRECAPTG